MTKRVDLKSLALDELSRLFASMSLPQYRLKQLLHWIYRKNALTLQDITEFSKSLRDRLSGCSYLGNITTLATLGSRDGSVKFLHGLEDGRQIESVLIPDGRRLTLCVSSQVGCALGCAFCETGRLGFTRNLRAHEIVDQVISANRFIFLESGQRGDPEDRRITNIVFMGMGEPLLNFDELVESLWRLVSFIGVSKRRITVSTAGIVPKMPALAEKAPDVNLAVSLNATTDQVRSGIMPVNRKYPLSTVLEACRSYPLKPRRRITFEYVMIRGVNDSREDAERLVSLVRGIRCKINLIPLNPGDGQGTLQRPLDENVRLFQSYLQDHHLTAIIRESRGQDIHGACGQLRAQSGSDAAETRVKKETGQGKETAAKEADGS